ncbi:MAG: glutamate--tRNA ligase [Gammaproteobacteria bacterium]
MHLGNARTALFSFLAAQHEGGRFVLRIEDTDPVRSRDIYMTGLMEDLTWLALHWDEGPERDAGQGPYQQSLRQAIYDGYYQQLETQGLAYPCFCTDEQLALNRKIQLGTGRPPRYPGTCRHLSREEIQTKREQGLPSTLRFKIPTQQTITFDDLVRGTQHFASDDIGDFIIRRANGTASFMFCNLIDDALMGVTHALRGEDHLANTPRQLMLAQALNLTPPQYGHMALILGSDGAPLSKRNGSRSISDLRQADYLPLAVVNYLARLGHYYEDNQLLTLEQLAAQFELSRLQKAPARFDNNQLIYWQKMALQALDSAQLWAQLDDATRQLVPLEQQQAFIALIQPNMVFVQEGYSWAHAFFAQELILTEELQQVLVQAGNEFYRLACQAIEQTGVDFNALAHHLQQHLGVKGKALFQPLRVALTGMLHGPQLGPILELMGQQRVLQRLTAAQTSLN